MAKSRFQRFMLIGIGVMVAIGFSGVFTYGSMVNTGSPTNNDRQRPNVSLPNQTFSEESYGLTINDQAYLSLTENVVFVNALYEEDKSAYSGLEDLPEQFDNRVYINLVNNSESAIAANYQLDMPAALVVGNTPSRRSPYSLRQAAANVSSIKSTVCSSFRDVSDFSATCFIN